MATCLRSSGKWGSQDSRPSGESTTRRLVNAAWLPSVSCSSWDAGFCGSSQRTRLLVTFLCGSLPTGHQLSSWTSGHSWSHPSLPPHSLFQDYLYDTITVNLMDTGWPSVIAAQSIWSHPGLNSTALPPKPLFGMLWQEDWYAHYFI